MQPSVQSNEALSELSVGNEQHFTEAPFTLQSHRWEVLRHIFTWVDTCGQMYLYIRVWLPLHQWMRGSFIIDGKKRFHFSNHVGFLSHFDLLISSRAVWVRVSVLLKNILEIWRCLFSDWYLTIWPPLRLDFFLQDSQLYSNLLVISTIPPFTYGLYLGTPTKGLSKKHLDHSITNTSLVGIMLWITIKI